MGLGWPGAISSLELSERTRWLKELASPDAYWVSLLSRSRRDFAPSQGYCCVTMPSCTPSCWNIALAANPKPLLGAQYVLLRTVFSYGSDWYLRSLARQRSDALSYACEDHERAEAGEDGEAGDRFPWQARRAFAPFLSPTANADFRASVPGKSAASECVSRRMIGSE
jgi:hypothetical protein